jgi:L-threonylcarbamoyladenylate synthase
MPTVPALVAESVAVAVECLRQGGVVACPTEAVWGLSCDPFDEAAVRRLLALKQRAEDKGLILVADQASQLDGLVDWNRLPAGRREAVLASWPGPHTWIVPASDRVPRWITGAHDGVAVRVSAHPVVAALCRGFDGPLVSTSANLAARPAPRRRQDIDPDLAAKVDAIVDGETGPLERPTQIRDARTGIALRE